MINPIALARDGINLDYLSSKGRIIKSGIVGAGIVAVVASVFALGAAYQSRVDSEANQAAQVEMPYANTNQLTNIIYDGNKGMALLTYDNDGNGHTYVTRAAKMDKAAKITLGYHYAMAKDIDGDGKPDEEYALSLDGRVESRKR